jgi:hypothetical protein
MNWWPRCRHCGEPIGVYEPLIALVEGRAHETSRAAGHRSDDPDADWMTRMPTAITGLAMRAATETTRGSGEESRSQDLSFSVVFAGFHGGFPRWQAPPGELVS